MKRLIICYFIFLLSLLSFFASGSIDSQDGLQYLAIARNIYYTGLPTAPPAEYDSHQNIYFNAHLKKDGHYYSTTGLGFSLAYVPAVAITDVIYKIYHISPPIHFPLESDWVIFFLASFTNNIFGAILGITLFLYFLKLKLTVKQAFLLSLASFFGTNLLVYTKHSYAHMMFTAFLILSFFLLKHYKDTNKKLFLLFSGVSFGIVMITYNNTFYLAVPSFLLYYLLLTKPSISIKGIKKVVTDLLPFLLGLIPLVLLYIWYENLRAPDDGNLASPLFLASIMKNRYLTVPFTVFCEGIYGQLLSPGRSIFIYSPLLLLIIILWQKIKKIPEFFVFIVISLLYILFYSTIYYSDFTGVRGITSLWPGESSWGPRYLIPIIPFGMLVVATIYTKLSLKTKYFIFLPLFIIGFFIELLGVIIPYQTRFHNMPEAFSINGTEYSKYLYINLLPRYSPIITSSRTLIYEIKNFPLTFNQGSNNVNFYDGIDFPFNVGPERWRVIEDTGHISFDSPKKNPVKKISLGLINHPINVATYSAKLQFTLNQYYLSKESAEIKLTERKTIDLEINPQYLKEKDNQLTVKVTYNNHSTAKNTSQILSLTSFFINDKPVNLERLSFPYVSPLGPKMIPITYQTYGGTDNDRWKFWEIHTQMYERIPDLWWIRNLFYWDIPKKFTLLLFLTDIIIFGTSFYYLLKNITAKK